MKPDDARLRLYVNVLAGVDDETLLLMIRNALEKNCFINGRKNFVNISLSARLLAKGMDRGENVVGLFKKVAAELDEERSSKAIERSIRSALHGAWSRACKHGRFAETTLLCRYDKCPRSKDFLWDLAAEVLEKIRPIEGQCLPPQ